LLDGAFAHVEGYPGADNLHELAEFFRSSSLRAAAFYIAHGGLPVPVVHGDAAIKRAVEDRLRALSQGAQVEGQEPLQLAQGLQRTARGVAASAGLTLGHVERGLRENQPGILARAF